MFNSIKLQMLLLIVVAFFVAIYVQRPILSNYYTFDGDSSPIIYWFNSIELDRDSANSNDLMSQYANWFVSPGTKIIYLLGSYFLEPIVLAKLIPIITSIICVFLMYRIGRAINGNSCGLIAGISFICVAWFFRYRQMFGSADAEELSLVLMLLFIYFLIKQRHWILNVIIFLQALVYPPLFFLSSLTLFGLFLLKLRRSQIQYINRKVVICLSLVILIATAFLYFKYELNEPEFLGRPLLISEVKKIEDLRPGGRNAILNEPDTFLSRLLNDTTGIGFDLPKKFMMAVVCFLVLLSFKIKAIKKTLLRVPLPFWIFLLAGFVMTFIANLAMFRLYEPSRYIQNPLNIFLIVFLSTYLSEWQFYLASEKKHFVGKCLILFYLSLFIVISAPKFGCHKESASEFKSAIVSLSSLPSDVFIAGHPKIMNGIGIYSKKRIFLTNKLSTEIYWWKYYQEMTKRTKDFFNAYYAQDVNDVVNFSRAYKLTHIVVDLMHFSEDYLFQSDFYYRPFNEYIKKITNGKTNFFLKNVPEEYIIFKDRNIYVIDCDKLSRGHSKDTI